MSSADENKDKEANVEKMETDATDASDKPKTSPATNTKAEGKTKTSSDSSTTVAAASDYSATGLSSDSCVRLLRACVALIGVPVEPDALNAIMRLSLRLTRDFELAVMFAELGGIRNAPSPL